VTRAGGLKKATRDKQRSTGSDSDSATFVFWEPRMLHFDLAELFSQTTAKMNQDLSLLCERQHLEDLDLLRNPY
jgi:hypothetical protein